MYCCTLARMVHHLLEYKILSASTVTQSGLYELLTSLMKKLSSAIGDFVKTDGISHLKPVILKLEKLFLPVKSGDNGTCCVMAHLIRGVLPAKIVDLIMDIATEKVSTLILLHATSF